MAHPAILVQASRLRSGLPTRLHIPFVLLLVVATSACARLDPLGPARITFGETVFDAGRVEQGAPVEHVFAFRNSGARDLRITRVRSSCDCVAVVPADSIIPAGKTAEIAATLDTTGLHGDVTRTIVVFSNDPSSPAILLKLKADVDFAVAAKPRRLYVGRVRPGEEVRPQGRIVLGDGIQVAALESAGPIIAAHLVEPLEGSIPDAGRRFALRIREQAPSGPFTAEVTVRATSRETPSLTIPVAGVVEGTP